MMRLDILLDFVGMGLGSSKRSVIDLIGNKIREERADGFVLIFNFNTVFRPIREIILDLFFFFLERLNKVRLMEKTYFSKVSLTLH